MPKVPTPARRWATFSSSTHVRSFIWTTTSEQACIELQKVMGNRRRREGPRLRASPVANQKGRSACTADHTERTNGWYPPNILWQLTVARISPMLLPGMAAVEYFILFQELDGTWCAAPPSFRTSLLDPVGRGNTRQEAITNLLRDRECQELIREQDWTEPTADDFLEVRSREINGNPNHTDWQPALRRRAFKVISRDKT